MKKFLLLIGLISQHSLASNTTPTLQWPSSTGEIDEMELLPGTVPENLDDYNRPVHRRLGEQSSTESIGQEKLKKLLEETMNSTPRVSQEDRERYMAAIQKLSPELRQFVWGLISTYVPTEERCRPSIRHHQSNGQSLLAMRGLDPKVAAMVTGYAQICTLNSSDLLKADGAITIDQRMGRLFAEMDFCLLTYEPANSKLQRYILFAPTAKEAALLYCKARIADRCNPYMAGHLLGYQEDDIDAYYIAHKADFEKPSFWCCSSPANDDNWIQVVEKHKQYSSNWIAKHSPTIEEWIEQNREQIIIRNYREQTTERQSNSLSQ